MTAAIGKSAQCSIDARIVRCTPIGHQHIRIEVALPTFPPTEPGQFLQLRCRDSDQAELTAQDWHADGFPSVRDPDFVHREPLLRRPFSIADRWDAPDGRVRLVVISRAVGPGTNWLELRRPGDSLNLTGPLGRGFSVPIADTPALLVGGGVGIPPLLYLARRLHELGRSNVTGIFGATTRALLPVTLAQQPDADGAPRECVEWPSGAHFSAVITSDDGSVGLRGFVTEGLRRWQARRSTADLPATVFACGPDGMLKAIARLTRDLGLACQLCIERSMGCGIGTCLSCVVRVRDVCAATGWRWALACNEGPVFPRDELLDYQQQTGA